MHLIINLVFLTSFQFINLSNLALWINNKRKWITVIFLNLCDNFLYYIYMICFFLLSLVFAFIYLCLCLLFVFVFVLYSPYFRHWTNPTADSINLFCITKKTFLNFTFFFFSVTCLYCCPTTSQQRTNRQTLHQYII